MNVNRLIDYTSATQDNFIGAPAEKAFNDRKLQYGVHELVNVRLILVDLTKSQNVDSRPSGRSEFVVQRPTSHQIGVHILYISFISNLDNSILPPVERSIWHTK
jgi:hypothetical protein